MKKKLMIIVGVITFLIIVCFSEEITLRIRIMLSCWEDYHNEFSLHNVYVDDEENEISLTFEGGEYYSNEDILAIAKVYKTVYDIIYSDEGRYSSYLLNIHFKATSEELRIGIWDISKSKEDIEVIENIGNITIADIISICPEVSSLKMISLEYESLEEFDEFTNLKYAWFSGEYRNYEVEERILARFPDCEFSWKK